MGIDSENDLYRKLIITIAAKIERCVYHKRRQKFVVCFNTIRQKLAAHFNEFEDYFAVDNMPLEVCKLYRRSRSTICK